MPSLAPGIHDLLPARVKSWMPATSAGMTVKGQPLPSPDLVGEELKRALAGEVGAGCVVAAALVAVEAVVGGVDEHVQVRKGRADLGHVVHGDVLVALTEVEDRRHMGRLAQ